MLVCILQYTIVTSNDDNNNTNAEDFLKIHICVALKTVGNGCRYAVCALYVHLVSRL